MYYSLVPGWLLRQEWSEYMAFHSKKRWMVKLNSTAYQILHSLVGRSEDEAIRHIAEDHLIDPQEVNFVIETARDLVDCHLLECSPTRPTISQKELDKITAPDTSNMINKYADDDSVNYYQTPASVLWSLTNRCNLKCRYCAPESGQLVNSELTLSQLFYIQEELSKHRVFEVIITGGEALLRKRETLSLLEALNSQNHFVHMLSNGLLIDNDIAERLAHLEIGIGVSLDGPTEEINSLTRGPGIFNRVIGSLQTLVKNGVWTNVLTVITRFNIDALDALFMLLSKLGIKYLVLQPLRPSGRAREIFETYRPNKEQLIRLPERLRYLKERFPEINVDDYEVSFWGEVIRRFDLSAGNPRTLLSCGAGTRFCVIDAEGEIAPCNALLDIRCGNLLDYSLPEIWHNSMILKELRMLASKSVCLIPECSECRFNVLCDGGCRADAYHATGSWIGLHPFCTNTQSVV